MDGKDVGALLGCGLGLAFMLLAFAVSIAIGVVICYQLYLSAKKLPAQHQKFPPASAFLLLVPLVNFVWLFFVVMKLSQGYQEYFAANPRSGVGDCGYGIGLGWAIATVCVFVPVAHFFAGLAALILMVLYLVKMSQLRALVTPPLPA